STKIKGFPGLLLERNNKKCTEKEKHKCLVGTEMCYNIIYGKNNICIRLDCTSRRGDECRAKS
ncbi:MAG: hypothetical protein J6J05_04250, partial [Peptococcaceae bacterium]|nr:hypothetical protein [Peptococcaceae bacterium]